jgi:exodeoxyribonuclease V alpha subunit
VADYFAGRVHTVTFHNPSQDFYILKVVLDERDDDAVNMFGEGSSSNGTVAVRGTVPGLKLSEGSWFGFEGKWETHSKYGRQIVITKAPVIKGGWTPETAIAMLQSQGVGLQVCERIRSQFGDDLVPTLDRGVEAELAEVPGITPFAAAHVLSRWVMVRAFFKTLEFLTEADVPKQKIREVWQVFGDKAKEILSTDPWSLVRIDGIRFEQADEVALRLGLDMKSPLRIRGAALYTAKNRRGMGHLFLSSGDMLTEIRELVRTADAPDVARALADLHKAGELVIDRTTRPGTTAIYEPWMLHIEQECASLLHARVQTAVPTAMFQGGSEREGVDKLEAALEAAAFKSYSESLAKVGVRANTAYQTDHNDIEGVARAALDDWSAGSHIVLSKPQMEGALNALTAPVSILTGLPGTGKTTTLKAVVAVLRDAEVPYLLCAPTGIAAKRMSSLTGAPAATIHRAFKAQGWDKGEERESTYAGVIGDSATAGVDTSDGSGEAWEYGPTNPHPAMVVVVDEFSMVDQHLLFRLLSCTSPKARLVMVGDPAQLPSVGPGNVLRDAISTGLFPTVNLTEIFRQEETSDIVIAAHKTFRGIVPETGTIQDSNSDFVLHEESDEDAVLAFVVRTVAKLFEKRRNFQVLSPRHAGTLGVTNLNQRLRTVLNPQSPGLQEMRLGSEIIREDDRVMVVKNRYRRMKDGEDTSIFNGDVGKVARLDRKAQEVEIKLHGPPVTHVRIPYKDAPTYLRLAYCVTCHKSQGQEFDVIVMPLVKGFAHQLQRNLFYTAITRAKKQVILVGQRAALEQAVHNNREDVRNTLFPDRLRLVFVGGSVAA